MSAYQLSSRSYSEVTAIPDKPDAVDSAYFNLKTYESFEEWAGDKEVAKVAEKLYVHIE